MVRVVIIHGGKAFVSLKNCENLSSFNFRFSKRVTNSLGELVNSYLPSILSVDVNGGNGSTFYSGLKNLLGFGFLSNMTKLVAYGNPTLDMLDGVSSCYCLVDLDLSYCSLSSLDELEVLASNQLLRNNLIFDFDVSREEQMESWFTSKFYRDSNGVLTGDSGEIRWLEKLTLNHNNITDIYGVKSLTHLTLLDLAANMGIGDTFEHNGITYDTYSFINTLAQNCFNNTNTKLTVNLKGTSITTATKNKINTDYCILQCDV